jgi:hypothetical protein
MKNGGLGGLGSQGQPSEPDSRFQIPGMLVPQEQQGEIIN